MATRHSYACKDYPGMEGCPGQFVAETEEEIMKLMELHAVVAHAEDPSMLSMDAWMTKENHGVTGNPGELSSPKSGDWIMKVASDAYSANVRIRFSDWSKTNICQRSSGKRETLLCPRSESSSSRRWSVITHPECSQCYSSCSNGCTLCVCRSFMVPARKAASSIAASCNLPARSFWIFSPR